MSVHDNVNHIGSIKRSISVYRDDANSMSSLRYARNRWKRNCDRYDLSVNMTSISTLLNYNQNIVCIPIC